MTDLGEVLDPVRKQVIDVKDALTHARYRYDGLDLILETVSDSKIRGAAQEIFTVATEKMNAVDDLLDGLYRELSDLDRKLEALGRAGLSSARPRIRRRTLLNAAIDVFTDRNGIRPS